MKRAKKITRAQKEEFAKMNNMSKAIVDSIDYDRKGAIIDKALRELDQEKPEEVPREKIILPETESETSEEQEPEPSETSDAYKCFTTSIAEKDKEFYYTVREFEKDVLLIDGIRVYVRASKVAKIRKYPFKKAAAKSTLVSRFIANRLMRTTDSLYEFELPGYEKGRDITVNTLESYQGYFCNIETNI